VKLPKNGGVFAAEDPPPVRIEVRTEVRQVQVGGKAVTVAVPVAAPVGAPGGGFNAASQGFTLEDAKGNVLPSNLMVQYRRDALKGITMEYTLTSQPGKDQGEPAKLVFSGSRSIAIDVPFTLKNVPLP
jgi:hypothetical protein